MSDVKHTPGPWCVIEGKLLRVSDEVNPPVTICGVHKIGSKGGPKRGSPRANARLIAAAPDLLEACHDALGVIEASGRTDIYDKMFAAIAKAKGKV